jgi:hypothetical protein
VCSGVCARRTTATRPLQNRSLSTGGNFFPVVTMVRSCIARPFARAGASLPRVRCVQVRHFRSTAIRANTAKVPRRSTAAASDDDDEEVEGAVGRRNPRRGSSDVGTTSKIKACFTFLRDADPGRRPAYRTLTVRCAPWQPGRALSHALAPAVRATRLVLAGCCYLRSELRSLRWWNSSAPFC